jgi:hypothetical protein
MATQLVSGNISANAAFAETIPITAGVITPLNLPTGISQNITYSNASTGASLSVDQVYGQQLNFNLLPNGVAGGNYLTLNFQGAAANSVASNYATKDLAGNLQSFARIRELHIQNLNSIPIYVFAGGSSGASAVQWMTSNSSSTQAITIAPNNSANSTVYPTLRLCDPVTSAVSSGMWVGSSNNLITIYCASSTSAFAVNVMAAGCTTL